MAKYPKCNFTDFDTRIYPSLKNWGVFEKLNALIMLNFLNVSKCDLLQCYKVWHVTNVLDFFTWYSLNISRRMLCILKIRIWSSFKGFFWLECPGGLNYALYLQVCHMEGIVIVITYGENSDSNNVWSL